MKPLIFISGIFVALTFFGCGGGGGNTAAPPTSTPSIAGSWAGSFTGTNHSVTLSVTIATNGTVSGSIYNTHDSVPGKVSGTIDNSGNMNCIFYYVSGGIISPAPGPGDYLQIGTVSINSSGHLIGSYTEYDDTGRAGIQGSLVATGTIDLTPVAPSSVNITGTWQGSVTETAFGTNIVTLNAAQVASGVVTGTYSSIKGTGSVNGTVSGETFTCTLSPTGCTGMLNGTGTVSGNIMTVIFSGTYICNGTVINDSGTGNLTKQ